MYQMFTKSPKLTACFLSGGFLSCVAVVLANREVVSPLVGFGLLMVGILVLAATAMLVVFLKLRGARIEYWYIFLFGLLPMLGLVSVVMSTKGVPMMNDVTTNLQNPPWVSDDRFGSYPDGFSTMMQEGYSDVLGMQISTNPVTSKKMEARLKREGFQRSGQNNLMYFYKLYKSGVFRFTDHLVVRVEYSGRDVTVDFRSKSDYGRSDFGVNADRIRGLHKQLLSL